MTIQDQKTRLRSEIRERRISLTDRHSRSQKIQQSAWTVLSAQKIKSVMVYVGYRSEVATSDLLLRLLEERLDVYVPWCELDQMRLFRLQSADELTPGAFGIPEPDSELRSDPDRLGDLAVLDAIVLPGIAFDRQGGRLGQGRGYYDRLLNAVSPECILIGLAFDVQMTEIIPVESHDISCDVIVTESEVIRCSPLSKEGTR